MRERYFNIIDITLIRQHPRSKSPLPSTMFAIASMPKIRMCLTDRPERQRIVQPKAEPIQRSTHPACSPSDKCLRFISRRQGSPPTASDSSSFGHHLVMHAGHRPSLAWLNPLLRRPCTRRTQDANMNMSEIRKTGGDTCGGAPVAIPLDVYGTAGLPLRRVAMYALRGVMRRASATLMWGAWLMWGAGWRRWRWHS